jgi:hypothetical protein
MNNVIQSTAPSVNFSIPTVGSSTMSSLGNIGAKAGGSSSAGTPGKISAKLFGTMVEASKLGVMLDVSGSAHPFLDAAIEEIEKNFPDAITILVMGCGMNKSAKAEVLPYSKANPDTKGPDKPGSLTTLGQIEMAKQRNKEFEKMTKRLSKRDDVYYVYGGGILATQHAFKKLLEEKADTIYWFADFQDAVDKGIAEDLAKDLSRADIKLYAHNFAGRPVRSEVEAMVQETGGKSIVQTPKKK